jgi:hypothetical protein
MTTIEHDFGKFFVKDSVYLSSYMLIKAGILPYYNYSVPASMQCSNRVNKADFTPPDLVTSKVKD